MDGDDLSVFRQCRSDWLERLTGADPSMKEDQRSAVPRDLIINFEPVDRCISSLHLFFGYYRVDHSLVHFFISPFLEHSVLVG